MIYNIKGDNLKKDNMTYLIPSVFSKTETLFYIRSVISFLHPPLQMISLLF